jgi:hypothetical protein
MPVKLSGSTSGYTILQASAVAGNNTLALPTTGTTLLSNGNTLTFTQTQTFAGNTSALAFACNNIGEVTTLVGASVPAAVTYDITTQSIIYYTSSAANNWTVNFVASSSPSTVTLNSVMSVGQSVTCVIMATMGATGYYQTAVTIDGTSVTPKWAGGITPAAGYTSSINVYTLTLVKTASATWTVLANLQKFA